MELIFRAEYEFVNVGVSSSIADVFADHYKLHNGEVLPDKAAD